MTEASEIRPRASVALLLLALSLGSVANAAQSVVKVGDRASLLRAANQAKPGTTILLAPGRYRGGVHFSGLRGEAEKPIVIAAADSSKPPVIEAGTTGMHLTDPVHVELRDLVIEGSTANGINIDDGGSFETPARHVVLRRLRVSNVGPKGNRDGIKLSGCVDFRVEGCTVETWGSGGSAIDMVGCHRGEIIASTFRKARSPMANGIQAKGGSRDIRVTRCRFDNAGGRGVNIGGSTGKPYFRPRPEGFEAKDIVVEDNIFVRGGAAVAFVGVDGATVRHNVIYRPDRWVVRILQETRDAEFVPSRKGRFERNIVVYRSDELRTAVNVGSGTAPKTFEFSRNFWLCADRPEATERVARDLPVRETVGVYGKDPRFRDPQRGSFVLEKGSPARGYGPRPVREGSKR